jgi:hypothetical protein
VQVKAYVVSPDGTTVPPHLTRPAVFRSQIRSQPDSPFPSGPDQLSGPEGEEAEFKLVWLGAESQCSQLHSFHIDRIPLDAQTGFPLGSNATTAMSSAPES